MRRHGRRRRTTRARLAAIGAGLVAGGPVGAGLVVTGLVVTGLPGAGAAPLRAAPAPHLGRVGPGGGAFAQVVRDVVATEVAVVRNVKASVAAAGARHTAAPDGRGARGGQGGKPGTLTVGGAAGAGAGAAGSGSVPVPASGGTANCLYPASGPDGFLPALQAAEQATGVTFSCLETFVDTTATWDAWVTPWIDAASSGYASWLAGAPARFLVISTDLVPTGVSEPNGVPDPAAWEPACASGAFDGYARELAGNLVSAGYGRAVIRLGFEMNGPWEPDFMGTTVGEQQSWATCFAREVAAMRSVPGAAFRFDWNPNACVNDVPLSQFYPGNAAVDLVGVDAYDAFCSGAQPAPSATAFAALAAEPDGLTAVAAFARSEGKPVSLPEWGAVADLPGGGLGDDGSYVAGVGQWARANGAAFQCYFDDGDGNVLELGTSSPATTAAYAATFG